MDLGAELTAEEEGLRLHFTPLDPVIAYRGFTLNPGNYILLHPDNHVEADVDLLADDGTGFKLYSTPNETALQDITLQVHGFPATSTCCKRRTAPACSSMLMSRI